MVLVSAPDVALSHERALSCLNEKFISLDTSAESLQAATAESVSQNEALQKELADSQAELELFVHKSLEKARELLVTAKETALSRYALTDDISALKDELLVPSEVVFGAESKTLLEHLESSHERLEQLEQARTYLRLVERGLQLSETAIHDFKTPFARSSTFSNDSLQGYVALHEFVASVSEACGSPDESSTSETLSVVSFLCSLRSRTWREAKNILAAQLLSAAENIKWPTKAEYESHSSVERRDFERTFVNLLHLQNFGQRMHVLEGPGVEDFTSKPGLYPLQVLVQPIAARFKFHFEGTRPTNRLDKPEWFFTHILNIVHEHKPFLQNHVQPLISSSIYHGVSAVQEFTYLLLPILSRKLRRTIPTLLPHPSLLAHTIYQTLVFDGSLREDGFDLEGTSATVETKKRSVGQSARWDGLSEIILGCQEWFETWLEEEKKFADGILNDIVSSGDAWQLVDDGDTNDGEDNATEIRPTVSARRVKTLVKQITDRYRHLPHIAHRLQFLLDIQLPILESYHARISSSLDAYENLSSSFMRAVPGALAGQAGHGIDRTRLTSGVEGLGRLFKAFVSASWIKEALESWGEELVFLELWSDINDKSALREMVAAYPLLPSTDSWSSAEGTLFDEMIKQFDALAARSADMMVRQIYSEVESDLKPWLTTYWDEEDEEEHTALSPTLLKPISSLSSSLTFLAASLPSAILTPIYKKIAGHVVGHLHQRLIYQRSKGRFTTVGGTRFRAQCHIWVQSCERALRGGGATAKVRRPEAGWEKIQDVATLLSIGDAEADQVRVAFDDGEEPYTQLCEQLGLNGFLSLDEAQAVFNARADTRR